MAASKMYRLQEDDAALQAASEQYFQEHPELNPATVSVTFHRTDSGYEAVGHQVIEAAIGYPVPAAAQLVELDLDDLAEAAFIAYSNRLNHTNHTMDVAEGWHGQGDEVRAGFLEAARAVQDRVLGKPLPETAPGLAHLEPGK